MTTARVLFWIAMIAWAAIEVRHANALAADDPTKDRGTLAWSLGAVLSGLVAAFVLDRTTPTLVPEAGQTAFLVTGTVGVVAGIGFRLWAIVTLGRFFTYQVTTAADHRVVSNGPYRWLSHPSYTGLLVSCAGAGIATANIASLVAVLAISTYGLNRRIRVEEQVLTEALGDECWRFRADRKRLVPGVW